MPRLETDRSSLKLRIERRVEVLREWKKTGIPDGQLLPLSLTELREWNDPALGIQRISSPNSFTKSHPQHGAAIRKAADLLAELHEKFRQPVPSRRVHQKSKQQLVDRAEELSEDLIAADERLLKTVEQWLSEKSAASDAKGRIESLQRKVDEQKEKLTERESEIAELRRQLALGRRLKVVE